jgi:hypothetical protein
MTKAEAIMRLMETVADDKPRKRTSDIKVSWTKRAAFRESLSDILLKACPYHQVEANVTEEERLFSSTFHLTVVGTVKNLNNFIRSLGL